VGGGDPADVCCHTGNGRQPCVPGPVHRFRGEFEARGGQAQELRRVSVGQATVGFCPLGERQHFRTEQRALPQEMVEFGLQPGVEVPAVVGDQDGGEHPERVDRQRLGRDRTERRRHDRQRGGLGAAQVVETHRLHAEGCEDLGHLAQFPGGAHPDRPVAFRGHAVDASQPLGADRVGGKDVGVHLGGDVHQGVVGRHLLAVHRGEGAREPGAQVMRTEHRCPDRGRFRPAAEHDHLLLLHQDAQHPVAHIAVGHRQRAHQPEAAGVGEQRVPRGQSLQALQQLRSPHLGGLEQVVGFDDFQDPACPHHVGEVAAPGGVDPGRNAEDVVRHLVHPSAGHHAADLQLLAERDDVRFDVLPLVGPRLAGQASAGLHLVHDEQGVVAVAQLLHRGEELRTEVVVAALTLHRLHDEAGDVVRVGLEGLHRLRQRALLVGGHIPLVGDPRRLQPRPGELREPGHLVRVGVGERHGVAAASVEGSGQVHHLGAELGGDAVGLVPAALPVEGDLECVLDGE